VIPSRDELQARDCWENDDRVPGRPEMTEFRRGVRYQQALWREANGHPVGSQPIAPRPGEKRRPVGSRIPLPYGRRTGANFVTAAALAAAKARTSITEPHQSFDHQRLWADLLWSPTLALNLFGDLARDLRIANRAIHAWWPDAPGRVSAVRFAHSPGRLDRAYIGSLVAWDAAFVLDLGQGTQGIIAVDTKYHEAARLAIAKPARLRRYQAVARTSGVFKPRAIGALDRTGLLVMWLEHLLALSTLQHPNSSVRWTRYVVTYPAGNSDFAGACARYADFLIDRSSFGSSTIEELLDARVLPARTTTALRERYLPR
jgi:hypothetical protein